MLCQILPYHATVKVMEDEKPCYGVSSASLSAHDISTSPAHKLLHHIGDIDFPETKHDLLHLLSFR